MHLHISDHVHGEIYQRILGKLQSYEKHSTVFRNRLEKPWRVDLKQGAKVDSHEKAGHIEVSIPITGPWNRDPKMIDYVSECAEAILFECGNAERSGDTKFIKDRLWGDTPDLSLMAAGEAQAWKEAEQMFQYLKGLREAKMHTTLSPQAERDLQQQKTKLVDFQRAFTNAPHEVGGAGVEHLSSKDRYAYESISLAPGEHRLRNIMRGIVRSGRHAQGYRNFIDEFMNRVNLDKSEYVAAYCSVMKVVEIVGPQGGWIKHFGYDFTASMMALARLTRLLPGTKTAMKQLIERIHTERWAAIQQPPLAHNPHAVPWLT